MKPGPKTPWQNRARYNRARCRDAFRQSSSAWFGILRVPCQHHARYRGAWNAFPGSTAGKVARSSCAPARVCALMALVEEAADDKGRAREWLARAIHAPRDPMWVSDGVANTRWQPVSPVTGEIVSCDWKVPYDMLPGGDQDFLQNASRKSIATAGPEVETSKTQSLPPLPDDPGITDSDA